MRSVKLIRSDWWSREKEVSDTETTTKNTHTVKEGMNEWVLSVSVSDVNFGMLFFVELTHVTLQLPYITIPVIVHVNLLLTTNTIDQNWKSKPKTNKTMELKKWTWWKRRKYKLKNIKPQMNKNRTVEKYRTVGTFH